MCIGITDLIQDCVSQMALVKNVDMEFLFNYPYLRDPFMRKHIDPIWNLIPEKR